MILGVGLAFETLKKEGALRPPKRQTSTSGHRSYAQAASTNLESEGAAHKPKKPNQPAKEKSEREASKEKAMVKLRSDNPTKEAPERRLILEPEMEGKRKENLSKVNFIREANTIVSHLLKIENALEWASRLERGGFLVQASEDFIQALKLIPDFKLQLDSMGTWIVSRKDPSSTPNGTAIAVEGVDLGLEPADVVYELAHRNHSVTGMNHGEVMNKIMDCQRCQRKDRKTQTLTNSRSMKMVVSNDLAEILLTNQGFYVASSPVFVRKWEVPKFRCYNCGKLGYHKARHCRAPERKKAQPEAMFESLRRQSQSSRPSWGDVPPQETKTPRDSGNPSATISQ